MNRIKNFFATTKHKAWVMYYCSKAAFAILKRGFVHDFSKYGKHEEPYFAKNLDALSKCTYNSLEYKANLERIKPAIQHHVSTNTHHPEFYTDSVNGMSSLDMIEMICDWAAAGKRSKDGSMTKSLKANQFRFKISEVDQSRLIRDSKEIGLS